MQVLVINYCELDVGDMLVYPKLRGWMLAYHLGAGGFPRVWIGG